MTPERINQLANLAMESIGVDDGEKYASACAAIELVITCALIEADDRKASRRKPFENGEVIVHIDIYTRALAAAAEAARVAERAACAALADNWWVKCCEDMQMDALGNAIRTRGSK